MKATIKDIVPGRVLYYVFCVSGKDVDDAHLIAKTIVTSLPNTNNLIGHLWFTCIDDHRPYGYDWDRTDSHHFLRDVGIMKKGTNPYNLHRLFTSEESALAYVEECKAGKFTDTVDQECYNKDLQPSLMDNW